MCNAALAADVSLGALREDVRGAAVGGCDVGARGALLVSVKGGLADSAALLAAGASPNGLRKATASPGVAEEMGVRGTATREALDAGGGANIGEALAVDVPLGAPRKAASSLDAAAEGAGV